MTAELAALGCLVLQRFRMQAEDGLRRWTVTVIMARRVGKARGEAMVIDSIGGMVG